MKIVFVFLCLVLSSSALAKSITCQNEQGFTFVATIRSEMELVNYRYEVPNPFRRVVETGFQVFPNSKSLELHRIHRGAVFRSWWFEFKRSDGYCNVVLVVPKDSRISLMVRIFL